MSEEIDNTSRPEQQPPQMDEVFQRMRNFLDDNVPHIGRMFGHELSVNIGNGWSTNFETGEVTADPRFFLEKGYSEDEACYATIHEVNAHLDEIVTEPRLTNRVVAFIEGDRAKSIFHNIFSDIAGNKLTHAVLPRMSDVAAELYDKKLFPDTPEKPIRDHPRHLQFLYSIIRTEMIPGSFTVVDEDVRRAIDEMRDFKGQGDLIKYSTDPVNPDGSTLTPEQRFDIWTRVIYPVFEQLKELDEQEEQEEQPSDGNQEQSGSDGAENQNSPNNSSSDQNSTSTQETGSGSSGEQSGDKSDKFNESYDDYFENKHPEPLSEEEHKKLHKHVEKKQAETRINPKKKLNEQFQRETGYSLQDKKRYDAQIEKWIDSIEEMREVFKSVLQERVAIKKGLSRQPKTEGAMLNPNTLAQTAIEVAAGVTEPAAFLDYEPQKRSGETVGKTDWVFVFDASGSMFFNSGEKARAAEASAVIVLEGLRAMQRDVEQAEAEHGIDLELDIRTAVYVFGSEIKKVKELSSGLTDKERYDASSSIRNDLGGTADFLALEDVASLPEVNDRRRIVVAVSDGESNDQARAKKAISNLRSKGWEVIGISVGSDEAEQLYQPTAKRTDNPAELPNTIKKLIEESYALPV